MDSGRQFTYKPLGSPASSAAMSFAICLAAAAVQGMGSFLMRAFWSDMLGVHTPLQSGSFASAAQSAGCGGGLITDSAALARDAVTAATVSATNPIAIRHS